MEDDDNEILDWGNEDDEHHETPRKLPFDDDQRDIDDREAEDSISLGDEDEDIQEYPCYRSEGANGYSANARDTTQYQLRAVTPQTTLITTGAKQELEHFSGETTHGKFSTPRKSGSAEDSPRRKNDARDQASPQRSQPNPGRLTHALPPKPVTTKVPPYLPPSHPSIVEATSMIISPRAGGREAKKSNGVSSGTSIPSTTDELPHNWEYREARNGAGKYYYNKETHISTWEKPVSIPSATSHAESRSRRRRSTSTGRRHRTPPDSNPPQSQTTRPSRNSAHVPPDREMDDASKIVPNELTYEDRHYRPSVESSAPIEIRATERFSEVVNGRVSSQSRYDRMQPASPPPSRRRPRSSSPHESRASYLHEKEKENQSSRGNSHSVRGQNASTNDPQRGFETFQPDSDYVENRWVRPPHPVDFPRSDHDSSRRRGRRQDDDQPMVDEHPDSRNRLSLRRRESSREPNRDREPPRSSELREDQNPIFLSAPRRDSTPLARDHDHFEPADRGYRAPPEDDRSIAPSSNRKDRSLRPDRQAPQVIVPTTNLVPSGPEVSSNRRRDRDLAPSPIFTHPSRRVGEREYDRNRREQPNLERDELSRRPVDYPPPANQIPEQSKRHYDREPSRPHPSDFDLSSPGHVGQPSHRKRTPLPPQTATFLTSSAGRDAPPHSSGAPVAPRSFRLQDLSGSDGNVPVGPRSMNYVNEEPPPRSGPTGGAEYDRDRGRNSSRQLGRVPNNYPAPLPLINTAMDVDDEGPLSTRGPSPRNGPKQCQEDDVESPSGSRWPSSHSTSGGPSRPTASSVSSENGRPSHLPGDGHSETRDFDRSRQVPSGRKEERLDRYPGSRSRSKGQPAEYMRPPAQPSSGTNNIPIGNRKTSVPSLTLPPIRYNPDARPPPSTLIDPAKARELLPPGKESYERPADLEIADTPQVRTANDASIHNNSRHSESSERQLALPPTVAPPGKSRRKSRFDKPGAQSEPRSCAREPSPISDKGTRASQSDASDKRAATPPPLSREHSVVGSMERLSSRLSDHGDARSDSGMVPAHPDTQTRHPVAEQRSDQPLLNRFSNDMIQHGHSLPDVPSAAHPGNAPASSRSGNRWVNDGRGTPQNRTFEQPQEHIRLPPAPDPPPTSLSHRLSDDKVRQRRGSMSGRDEKSREMGLSFHNAHAKLEPEEGMAFQDRWERPQVQRRGASLLDRLSAGNSRSQDSGATQQSLRDRIIPSKRDREDMMEEGMRDVPFEGEDGTESKRARRKGGRARTRGGRRGAPGS